MYKTFTLQREHSVDESMREGDSVRVGFDVSEVVSGSSLFGILGEGMVEWVNRII